MNEQLRELYQEVIIDHGRNPRNFKKLADPSCTQQGYNPLCGDRLTLYLQIENNIIVDASFEGEGCAISIATASLMTERIKNCTIEEAQYLFSAFHQLVTEPEPGAEVCHCLGKLTVVGGVREFPIRIKCATLVWHALKAGLGSINAKQVISTE